MSTTSWRIEPGAIGQIAEIQAVEVQAGELFHGVGLPSIADDDPPSAAILQQHLDDQTLWVAIVGVDVVGYLMTSVVDGQGHIDQISVAPSAGRVGIGSALVEEAATWARAKGFSMVSLTTFAGIAWNGPFYSARGFVEIESVEIGPELAKIRAEEIANGVEVAPRIAMKRAV